VQRELVQILGQAVGLWMGLGGPVSGDRVKAAWDVLGIVLRTPAAQEAIRAVDATALRVLLEGR
jgi:hypothetical protein